MASSDEIHKEKLDFLEEREAGLKKKVGSVSKKLYEVIVEKILDQIETEDGVIKASEKNIRLTQLVSEVFEDFDTNSNKVLLSQYIEDINKNTLLNERYFQKFSNDEKTFNKIAKNTKELVRSSLGINNKGSLIKGGFLDSFVKDNRMQVELQNLLTKGITGGASVRELRNDLNIFVLGPEGENGALEKKFGALIYDTYQQIDRMEAGVYANELKMSAFIYSGGKIANTRKFCCQRNGLIFTTEEAKSWKNLKFAGKTKNYNPLIDLGGYGCRHSAQYISNVIAAKRREDLELDEKGNLKYKEGATKQKLNSCS